MMTDEERDKTIQLILKAMNGDRKAQRECKRISLILDKRSDKENPIVFTENPYPSDRL